MPRKMKTKRTTITTAPLKPSAAIKQFLKPWPPQVSALWWQRLTESDFIKFKKFLTKQPDNIHKRAQRRDIKKSFGKSIAELTLDEWKDYQKPNFHAPDYLKELWPQLKPAEQELVKQLNEWAFIFPASFETGEQFLRACAKRLERFFGRKFRVKRT